MKLPEMLKQSELQPITSIQINLNTIKINQYKNAFKSPPSYNNSSHI